MMLTRASMPIGNAVATDPIRVVMIDRQRSFVQALTRCAESTPDLRIVDSADDLAVGENSIRVHRPHLVVMDILGSLEDVVRVRESLAVRLDETRVVVFTDGISDRMLDHSIYLGTSCLLKSERLEVIFDAFRRVHGGELYFSPGLRERLNGDSTDSRPRVVSRSSLERFTPKQIEVLKAIARGQKVKDVARRMHLSPKSVEAHKYRIMNLLGIHDRVELCLYAVREGLIQP
jgi:DNA-binding NarL/FixJ family response regulator